MKSVVTIKGQPIIEVYESFDGSYWFVTEKAWKQDSLIARKVYKQDQILCGYVRLSSCPQSGRIRTVLRSRTVTHELGGPV